MKNDKLIALVNKLVEFNNGKIHLKGYLFNDDHDSSVFYIKPIAVFKGTKEEALEERRFDLNTNANKHIKYAETPKLMKVSMKSWHYRLMRYVLVDSTPTPKTMQNGCPYAWLLIFCLLFIPFKLLAQAIGFIFMLIPNGIHLWMESIVNNYFDDLDDYKAYDMSNHKIPYITRKYLKNKNLNGLDYYITKKYKIPTNYWHLSDKENVIYQAKKEAIRDVYIKKQDLLRQKRNKLELQLAEKSLEERRKRNEREAKIDARNERIALKMEPFFNAMGNFVDGLRFDTTKLIKGTKNFLGFLISTAILGVTSGFIIILTRGLIYLIGAIKELFINYGTEIGIGALVILAAGLAVILVIVIYNKVEVGLKQYKEGKPVWYLTLIINIFWTPLVLLGKGIYYSVLYGLYKPLEFIIYTCLYLIILRPTGIFLGFIGLAILNILGSSFGIFGEYFSASKKDYCPGLEWTDVE